MQNISILQKVWRNRYLQNQFMKNSFQALHVEYEKAGLFTKKCSFKVVLVTQKELYSLHGYRIYRYANKLLFIKRQVSITKTQFYLFSFYFYFFLHHIMQNLVSLF